MRPGDEQVSLRLSRVLALVVVALLAESCTGAVTREDAPIAARHRDAVAVLVEEFSTRTMTWTGRFKVVVTDTRERERVVVRRDQRFADAESSALDAADEVLVRIGDDQRMYMIRESPAGRRDSRLRHLPRFDPRDLPQARGARGFPCDDGRGGTGWRVSLSVALRDVVVRDTYREVMRSCGDDVDTQGDLVRVKTEVDAATAAGAERVAETRHLDAMRIAIHTAYPAPALGWSLNIAHPERAHS
jgi:hypothetical protein